MSDETAGNEAVGLLAANARLQQAHAQLMSHAEAIATKLQAVLRARDAMNEDFAKLRAALEQRTKEHDMAVRRCDDLAADNTALKARLAALERSNDPA